MSGIIIRRKEETVNIADAAGWPIEVIHGSYGNSPGVACDGWVKSGAKLGFSRRCQAELTGGTLGELVTSLAQHLESTEHVPSPFPQLEGAMELPLPREEP